MRNEYLTPKVFGGGFEYSKKDFKKRVKADNEQYELKSFGRHSAVPDHWREGVK